MMAKPSAAKIGRIAFLMFVSFCCDVFVLREFETSPGCVGNIVAAPGARPTIAGVTNDCDDALIGGAFPSALETRRRKRVGGVRPFQLPFGVQPLP